MATRILAAYYLLENDKDWPEVNFSESARSTRQTSRARSKADPLLVPSSESWDLQLDPRYNKHVNVQADHYKSVES